MTRVELAEAIKEKAMDCEFSMPFFLMGCLVEEMKRQKLTKFDMSGPAFKATVRLKATKDLTTEEAMGNLHNERTLREANHRAFSQEHVD